MLPTMARAIFRIGFGTPTFKPAKAAATVKLIAPSIHGTGNVAHKNSNAPANPIGKVMARRLRASAEKTACTEIRSKEDYEEECCV